MNSYIATFHTHLAALKSHRALGAAGISARMAPVPRKLSSSCGTCVRYQAAEDSLSLLDRDVEAVYQYEETEFRLLHHFE